MRRCGGPGGAGASSSSSSSFARPRSRIWQVQRLEDDKEDLQDQLQPTMQSEDALKTKVDALYMLATLLCDDVAAAAAAAGKRGKERSGGGGGSRTCDEGDLRRVFTTKHYDKVGLCAQVARLLDGMDEERARKAARLFNLAHADKQGREAVVQMIVQQKFS